MCLLGMSQKWNATSSNLTLKCVRSTFHLQLFTANPHPSCYCTFNSYFALPQNSLHALHQGSSRLSLGRILMGLQGPSRSNYVEQLLSFTGPRLPGENANLPGKQNSTTFDKTLNTCKDVNNANHSSLPLLRHRH